MIRDLRFFPKERNHKIFKVIAQMLVHRNLLTEDNKKHAVDILNSSFDTTTQVACYDQPNKVGSAGLQFKIKFVSEKVSTINKVAGLLSFIETNQDMLTFIIINDIYLKPFKEIMDYPNTEIFWVKEFFINPIAHVFMPKIKPLNSDEKQRVLDEYDIKLKDLPKMEKIDFEARYYNLKCGDIIEITRPSIASGEAVFYRIVVNTSWDKLFAK
jgi:DNA-directed RNA polymerase subunit H (RpoH/RPB5)